MADWTEKHRPETLSEIRGNNKARDALQKWANTWESHREPAILHGSPGVGKTSAAYALANDMGWPTMELNASDQRTKDAVERFAGRAARNATLGGSAGRDAGSVVGGEDAGRQLVIMDEADNLHGNADRGGSQAITSLITEAEQPIVLIANEFYDMSNSLRNAAREIEFRDVSSRSIVPALRDICRKEGIEFEEDALQAIAENTSGDLRSAVNDLQAIAEGRDRIVEDDVMGGDRDTTTGIFDYLDVLIKEASAQEALEASYDVDETPDDLVPWIDENVPKDYHGAELADAYEFIARADRWLGRVRATQNYSYWRYVSDNATAGVAASRREEKGGWTRYGPPSYWSKLGRSKGARNTRDYVARQIAEDAGVSMGTARGEILPYLSAMTHHCRNRELTVTMAARYELDAEHVSFVTGSGEDTNKVQGIVEDARDRREAAATEGAGSLFEPRADEEVDEGDDADEDDDVAAESSETDDSADTEPSGDESAEAEESSDQQTGLGDFG